ncbi:MAG: hypothetical protein JRG76_01850 [Deltaproteobacteria bacterium]|nr:hypothetical protein [Deltaproteobacteria bacterium]MBW2413229.1 hypothetical protein [Deltaproteobacteria bacterium]
MTDDGELEGDLHGDSAVKGVTIGFGAGAITGAGAGFGYGLIVCVPTAFFYPFCVVATTFVGFVVGAGTGLVAGGSTGLPWKTTGEVNTILERLQHEPGRVTRELEKAVKTAVPRKRQVGKDRAEAIVTARVDEFDLRQHFRQRLSLRMKASMMQEWQSNGGPPKTNTCEYVYTSSTMDVEDWLLHDGKLFTDTVNEGIGTFARWMARDLDAFSTRRAELETELAPATCFQIEQ